jgi:hypothetical protein
MTNSPDKISAVPIMLSSWRGELGFLFMGLNTFNDLTWYLKKLESDLKAVNFAKMFRIAIAR